LKINLLEMERSELKRLISGGKLKVAIYGLGYVGLSLAAVWLRAGARVIGVEVDRSKVERLITGYVPTTDKVVAETVKKGIKVGRLTLTSDGVGASKESNVKIVTVPVPLINSEPSFDNLNSALTDIAKGLDKGDVVIIESSVPPTTTLRVALPLLESRSGLKCEDDFALAYSPERILIGRAVQDIEERYPKVVAGVGPRSTKVVKDLYSLVARKGVLTMSNPTAAELEKLLEGVYRDVNIALVNELAPLISKLGLDFWEIIEIANSQPYCHLHKPGPGVGGACIPIYPKYVLYIAKRLGVKLPLIELARTVNENMPAEVAKLALELLEELGKDPSNSKVTILGLAFRGDINDSRLSPTYGIISSLKEEVRELVVHDPFIGHDPELERLGVKLINDLRLALKGSDLVIVVTDHSNYKGMKVSEIKELSGRDAVGVIDTRGVLSGWEAKLKGVRYVGIGRPWYLGMRT